MKTPRFSIRLEGETLVFPASHFITFRAEENGNGNAPPMVESLHRHDFRVRVKIDGPLGSDDLLLDFQTARDTLLEILADCRDKTILAINQPGVQTRIDGNRVEIVCDAFSAPLILRRDETFFFAARNASTEAIALFLAQRLFSTLEARGLLAEGADGYSLTLSLEEEPGMIAEVSLG